MINNIERACAARCNAGFTRRSTPGPRTGSCSFAGGCEEAYTTWEAGCGLVAVGPAWDSRGACIRKFSVGVWR